METIADQHLSQAEASRRLGYPARVIAIAVYNGRLDASTWPLVAGRRLVPIAELERIRVVLTTDRRLSAYRRRQITSTPVNGGGEQS